MVDDAINQPSERAGLLAEVVLMTEEMLVMARQDKWEQVTELEERRRVVLNACFSEPVPSSQSNIFSEALAAMLYMNEELVSLLESAKSRVAIKRTKQRSNSKSLGHYLDVSQFESD